MYVKGNLINIFVYDNGAWKAIGYSTNASLSRSNEVTGVSSKDHGAWADQEVTASSFEMSGEYLFSPEGAAIIDAAYNKKAKFSACFAQCNETEWKDGIKGVTGVGTTTAWTIGNTGKYVQYGDVIVTSVEIGASQGDNATMSVTFTGSGALTTTVPTSPIAITTASK